ncbi:MAG: DsbA family protein [Candidatus Saccharibacteria bacterium]|nr:DsbA family protein [Candidatus Saccharibacteria bacterium]
MTVEKKTEKKTAVKKVVAKKAIKEKTPRFKNSVKGKNNRPELKVSRGYFAFSIITMMSELLVIIVLTMALTSIGNGPKYVMDNAGNITKVREDKPVKNGTILETDRVVGNPDSKVAFIWYVDMQCPACAQMAPLVNELYSRYGDRVAFATRYLEISGHNYTRPATIAVEAARRQGYFWVMLMEMFEQRGEWAYVNSNEMLTERFEKIFVDATDGKGDLAKFAADMADESIASVIDIDRRMVIEDSLNFTPTIIIDGMNIDFAGGSESVVDMFTKAIDEALAK